MQEAWLRRVELETGRNATGDGRRATVAEVAVGPASQAVTRLERSGPQFREIGSGSIWQTPPRGLPLSHRHGDLQTSTRAYSTISLSIEDRIRDISRRKHTVDLSSIAMQFEVLAKCHTTRARVSRMRLARESL